MFKSQAVRPNPRLVWMVLPQLLDLFFPRLGNDDKPRKISSALNVCLELHQEQIPECRQEVVICLSGGDGFCSCSSRVSVSVSVSVGGMLVGQPQLQRAQAGNPQPRDILCQSIPPSESSHRAPARVANSDMKSEPSRLHDFTPSHHPPPGLHCKAIEL